MTEHITLYCHEISVKIILWTDNLALDKCFLNCKAFMHSKERENALPVFMDMSISAKNSSVL